MSEFYASPEPTECCNSTECYECMGDVCPCPMIGEDQTPLEAEEQGITDETKTIQKKVVCVIGATGNQGGSVARFLLADREHFIVRCMIRSLDSQKAQDLFSLGAQLVKGDLNDPKSLREAFHGCEAVFAVTNFWDPTVGYEGEIRQGRNIADACAATASVKHVVWSTLDRNSGVPHFQSKVEVEDYFRSLASTSTFALTSLVTSFYFENFFTFFPPKKNAEGTWMFATPQLEHTRVPMYSVLDTGGWVRQIFLHSDKYSNRDVSAVSDYITYPELVQIFATILEQKADYHVVPPEEFKGFPGAEELLANFKYFDDISSGVKQDRRNDLVETGEIWEDGMNWEDFVTLFRDRWLAM